MPVYRLADEMPYDEYEKWQQYFEARPVGWRDDDRTAKLLQAQGVKAKPEAMFSSLAKLSEQREKLLAKGDGRISAESLKRSLFFSKMLSASGGDKLELE